MTTGKGALALKREQEAEPPARPRHATVTPAAPQRSRVRMSPDARIDMILDGAVAFFAKHGLIAQTRELARALGVSQSLIYHYFKTKDDLVERVYERAFNSRWRDDWLTMLADRGVAMADRLKGFYKSYLSVIDDSDYIRLVMIYGLDNSSMPRRYLQTQISSILRTIATELNAAYAPGRADEPPRPDEIESVWLLQSTFFHYLVRKHILRSETPLDTDKMIDDTIDHFLAGAVAIRSAAAPAPQPAA